MDSLTIKIFKPEAVFFTGEIASLSSQNSLGNFDILPDHANFITVIEKNLTLYFKNGSTKVLEFDIGVLRLFGVEIDVYLGIKTS